MVVGDVNYKAQSRKVAAQLEAMRSYYGELVVIAPEGPGPGHVALGWAAKNGVYHAGVANLRATHGDAHKALSAHTMLLMRPEVCVAFGACHESEITRAAGVPTYQV